MMFAECLCFLQRGMVRSGNRRYFREIIFAGEIETWGGEGGHHGGRESL